MRATWAVAGTFLVGVLWVLGSREWNRAAEGSAGGAGGAGGSGGWSGWVASADSALVPKSRSWNDPKRSSDGVSRLARQAVELNTADSLALVGVYGIGPVFAGRILAYRAALGGFYRIEQLREVRGMSEEVFFRVAQFFRVDEARIEKININFVAPAALAAHPYVTPNMAQRLVGGKLKGGYYNKVEDLLNRDILLPGEAKRLAPYLLFAQAE